MTRASARFSVFLLLLLIASDFGIHASPSTVTTKDQTWAGGGAYTWNVNSATGPSGSDPGSDLLQINGALSITANSDSPFTIHLVSLGLNDLPGAVYDFNNQSNYVWTIVHTTNGISGFAPGDFTLDQTGFSNALAGGAFALQVSGNDLQLQFTPILASGNAFTWTGGAGTSDWFTPGNWSPTGVPSSTDSVTIDSGVVNLSTNATVANLTFSGGALTGAGQLSVANLFNWTGGVLQQTGPTVVMTGAKLNITGSNNHDLPGGTITNFGTVTWTGGSIRGGGNGSSIQNFGLWDVQSDNVISADFGGTGVVIGNYGIFRKSAGTGVTTIANGVVFNNNALLDVESGTLVLSGTGSSSGGRFNTASSGTIYFNSDYGLDSGSSFTGAGTNLLSLGTLTLSGSYTSTNFIQTGGRLAGTNILHGLLTWSGGDWTDSGATTIAIDGTLNIVGQINHDLPNHTLTNLGTVVWIAGGVRGGGNGTFIQNLGLWDAQTDNVINDDYGGAGVTFNNIGTFRKSAGTGTTTISSGVTFNNSGLLDVRTGTLLLSGGGESPGGTFNAASTATVDFNSNYNLDDGSSFTGNGTNLLSFGTLTLNGSYTSSNLTQIGGRLAGTNTLHGVLTWSGGDWSNTGSTTIAVDGVLNVASQIDHDLPNHTLTNLGAVIWLAGNLRGGGTGTLIQNSGFWNARSDNVINDDYGGSGVTFNNFGVFRKSSGTGITAILGGVTFNNNGLLDVQSGTFRLDGGGISAGGRFNASASATIDFNANYSVNAGSIFMGSGATVLSGGTLLLNGSYTSANLTQTGGTLAGTNTLHGVLTWSGGNWIDNGFTTVAVDGILNIEGDFDHDLPSHSLTNFGTVNWIAGHIRGGGTGTVIQNFGLWDAQSDNVINDDYGGQGVVFNNFGAFRKSAGTGVTAMLGGVAFDNISLVDIQTGTLILSGSGESPGGTFNAASGATIDFNSNYNLDEGSSFTGAGTNLLTAGTLKLNGSYTSSNLRQTGGELAGTNTLHGTFTWVGGDWNGNGLITIATNSTLNILAAVDHDIANSTLTNFGTVNWTGGRLRTGLSTRIYNFNLWNAQVDADVNADFGSGALFASSGLFHKSLTTNSTTFQTGVRFSNTGSILVDDGALVFNDGGTFLDGSVLTGAGITRFQLGNFTLDGVINCTNLQQTGGQVLGTNFINGVFNFSAGVWSAFMTITTNSTLNILSAANHDIVNSSVTNYGTVVWTGGLIRGGGVNGTTYYNFGLWDDQLDSVFNNDYGGGGVVFNNYGTFRKSSGTGSTAMLAAVFFKNNGLLDVQTGTLTLSGGGASSGGIFNAAASTTIEFNSSFVLNDTSSFTGVGSNLLSAGILTLNGSYTSSNLRQTGGRLAGMNVLNGTFNWLGGDWDGGGLITIATNSTLNILTAADHDMSNSTLTNYGTVNWTGGRIRMGTTARINNFNLWNAQIDSAVNADLGGGAIFSNAGTFHKSTATNSTIFQNGVHFSNTGAVLFDDGPLVFNDGGAFLDGTVLAGASTSVFQAGTFLLDGVINCTNVQQTGGSLIGTNVLNGAFSLLAGTWSSMTTLSTNSTLNILSPLDHDFPNGSLTNYGTVIWTGGRIRGGGNNGTSFYNFGLWDVQLDNVFNNDFGGIGLVFNNLGTFRKSAGSGTAGMLAGVAFNNSGLLDIQTGAFIFSGGGASPGGIFNAATGATINFNADYRLNDSSSLTGGGTNLLSAGTLTLNGTYSSSNLRQTGGRLAGTNVLNGTFTWLGGDWNGAGLITISSNSTLNILTPVDHDISNATLTNYGTVNWSGGRLRTGTSTRIYNLNIWNTLVDADVNADYGSGGVFANAGTFHKFSTTNTTTFQSGVRFSNTGSVITDDGTLLFNDGGSFFDGTLLAGTGLNLFHNGTFNLNGLITATNAAQNGGTIVASNLLNGAFTFTAGIWTGLATLMTNSTLHIVSEQDHDFVNCVLTNYGTIVWTGGRVRGGGANGTFFYNFGVWDIQNDNVFNADYGGPGVVFINEGVLQKLASSGVTTMLAGVLLNNSGLVNFQSGTLTLSGGANLADNSHYQGAGAVLMAGGGFIIGSIQSQNLQFTGGNLSLLTALHGLLVWSGGDFNHASSITIASDGVLLIATGNDHDLAGTTLINQGLVTWTGGRIRGGNTSILNNGTWDAQVDAEVNADYGGSGVLFKNTGVFRKSAGPGSTTFQSGAFLDNTGAVNVQSGVITLNGGGLIDDGSILAGSGQVLLANNTTTLNGAITFSNLQQIGGVLAGTNVLHGPFTWTAGIWSSALNITIPADGTLQISSANDHDLPSSTLTNLGTVNWIGGRIRTSPNSRIDNVNLWNIQVGAEVNADYGSGGIFANAGTFHKFSTTNATSLRSGVLFVNTGLVIADDAPLVFNDGGAFHDGTVLTGDSQNIFQNGVFTLDGMINSTNVLQIGGILAGTNLLNGVFNFASGTWSSLTTIATNSTLNILSAADHDFPNCVLTNNGNVIWTGGRIRGGTPQGTTFHNFALWTVQSDYEINADFNGAVTFDNSGTFRKTQATNTTTIRSGVSFNNTGVLDIQRGLIVMQGNYNPDPASQVFITLAGTNPGTGYGQLSAATLAGSLTLIQDSSFFPTNNAVFNIVLYPSENGVFSAINGLHTTSADFTPTYTATSLNITVSLSGYEGDVSPRPNGRNDGTVSITSWVQVGRFVAGLDAPNPGSEFARADCAPRLSGTNLVLGNGLLTIADWVQAGRYAAGLDPITPVGGPTVPNTGPASLIPGGIHTLAVSRRAVHLIGTGLEPGVTNTILVAMDLQGDENAVGFSLAFDPSALRFLGLAPGSDVSEAAFLSNLNQSGAGRIGVALARLPGQFLGSGAKILARLSVLVLPNHSTSQATVTFGDFPIRRETVNSSANPLETSYKTATFALISPPGNTTAASIPALTIARISPNSYSIVLQGEPGGVYELQSSSDLLTWAPIDTLTFSAVTFQEVMITNMPASYRFYRSKRLR